MKTFFFIVATLLGCVAGLAVSYCVIIFILFLVLFLVCLTCNRNKEYTKFSKFYYDFYIWGSKLLCFVAGIRIHVTGKEKIPFGKRFFLVSNHRSNFDNIVQGIAFKEEPLAYISKPENFKLPFVGRLVKRNLFLPIERGNPKKGLETILKASEYVKSDLISIAVYPEGTRSKDCVLREFKPGCFKVAEKSKCPIVVVATRGTENIHKNSPWKKTDVYLDVVDVLLPEQTEGKKTVDLCSIAYDRVSNFLKENDKY